ncbi:MAG: alpha/beta fold hydrolase [Aquificae bacterium]|nr:alpha/beta fold hydrolase [Aquificota bacterium]
MLRVHFPEAVVLLHAFPLNKDMYRAQFCAFEREGIPYVALDYPGFGDAPNLPGEYTVERITDYVLHEMRRLRIKRAVFIGDSMGGYVMFDFWRRYREVVKGFVFVATRAEADTEEGKKARYALIERVQKEGKDFLIEAMLENQTSPATKKDEKKMRKLRCIMEKSTKEGIVKTLKALAERRDNRDLLKEIDVPTLVIAGKDDERVTPPGVVKKIAEGIKGAEYHELENAAHLPPFENPKAFNEIVIPFLKRLLGV